MSGDSIHLLQVSHHKHQLFLPYYIKAPESPKLADQNELQWGPKVSFMAMTKSSYKTAIQRRKREQ